jgi:tRNA(Arg) A34 adenosine deaminase TadA
MNSKMNSKSVKILGILVFLLSIQNFTVYGQLEVAPLPDDSRVTETDKYFIKKVYEIARKASETNYPYGALLVHEGKIIAMYGNKVKETGDITMHAETGLLSDASKEFGEQILANSTLYTSTEPCIMCSGAIYWASIPKIVYGTTELQARLLFDPDAKKRLISSREAFNRIRPDVEIIGPVLEEEGLLIHEIFSRKK